MGWTGTHTDYYKNGKVDRRMACRSEYNKDGYEVLKDSLHGSVYYAAVKHPDDHVFGLVVRTSVDNNDYFNFKYKDMPEDMGPCYYDCPMSILNLLSKTDHEYALEWRKKCRAKQSKPAKSALPIGAIIKVKGIDTEERIAIKRAPNYQFKNTWWYIPYENTYMPSRYINSFDVIAKDEALNSLYARIDKEERIPIINNMVKYRGINQETAEKMADDMVSKRKESVAKLFD